MKKLLRRKVNDYLIGWKNNSNRLPLIVKGARQVGKTASIEAFADANYDNVIKINFVEQPQYCQIFNEGFEVSTIVKNITLINPQQKPVKGKTLIFFDEMQSCPSCATALKFFKIDGSYDIICSGSLMGINYKEIESNSVGYKTDYEMHSMDFEEYLWAKGYDDTFVSGLLDHMLNLKPLTSLQMDRLSALFREYMTIGGMPAVVDQFVNTGTYSDTAQMQRQLLIDYEEDITKYAVGHDKAKIKAVYNHIPAFLAKGNKRFQITKIGRNARNREYIGTVEWLADAGIVNVCYCMAIPELPLKGNYDPKSYKLYFKDSGLLMASLDEEAQLDVRINRNFNTYKGAIYENIVGDMLVKQGYALYYYKSDAPAIEIDFFIRNADSLIPIEVKASDGTSISMKKLIVGDKYADIKFGIKLCNKNIGFDGAVYTFPYFLTFLLKEALARGLAAD